MHRRQRHPAGWVERERDVVDLDERVEQRDRLLGRGDGVRLGQIGHEDHDAFSGEPGGPVGPVHVDQPARRDPHDLLVQVAAQGPVDVHDRLEVDQHDAERPGTLRGDEVAGGDGLQAGVEPLPVEQPALGLPPEPLLAARLLASELVVQEQRHGDQERPPAGDGGEQGGHHEDRGGRGDHVDAHLGQGPCDRDRPRGQSGQREQAVAGREPDRRQQVEGEQVTPAGAGARPRHRVGGGQAHEEFGGGGGEHEPADVEDPGRRGVALPDRAPYARYGLHEDGRADAPDHEDRECVADRERGANAGVLAAEEPVEGDVHHESAYRHGPERVGRLGQEPDGPGERPGDDADGESVDAPSHQAGQAKPVPDAHRHS